MSRKVLEEHIGRLGPTEHQEIFRILLKHNIPFTQNNNGTFVNISSTPESIIEEISNFVSFCTQNNKELDEYDKMLHQCKLYQKIQPLSHVDGQRNVIKTSDLGGAIRPIKEGVAARPVAAATTSASMAAESHEPTPPPHMKQSRVRRAGMSDLHRRASTTQSTNHAMPAIESIMKWVDIMEKTPDPVVGRRTVPYASAKYTCARKKYSKKQYKVQAAPSESPATAVDETVELMPEPVLLETALLQTGRGGEI